MTPLGVDQVISAFESRTDLDQYTDESVKAVNDLIAEYQSKTGLTQDEIDEYLSKIQSAIDGLRYEIDTTAIDREIKKFNEMTLTNYTAESVKAVRDVIDEYTRAIAAGENLSQNDVDQYLARIQEKVAALEWTSGEHYGGVYDKIRELIQQAYDMLNFGTHYLEDAITEVNNAIQHAQQVLKIPDLSYRSEEAEDAIFSWKTQSIIWKTMSIITTALTCPPIPIWSGRPSSSKNWAIMVRLITISGG